MSENYLIAETGGSLTPYSEMLPYPNLVVCGAPRSGSSSLIYSLQEHPDLSFMVAGDLDRAEGREYGHPLINPFAVCRREQHLELQKAAGERARKRFNVVGLALRYALYMPHIAFNLVETIHNPKIVFILRNPVNRAYSSYTHPEPGERPRTFEETIKLSMEEIDAVRHYDQRNKWVELPADDHPSGMLERGAYYPHLIRYFRLFPRESIHVIKFEDFIADPNTELGRVLDFLGLAPFTFTRVNEPKGTSRNKASMLPATKEYLQEYFREFNAKLFRLLDWPEDTWDNTT